jgi:hypothetical protein
VVDRRCPAGRPRRHATPSGRGRPPVARPRARPGHHPLPGRLGWVVGHGPRASSVAARAGGRRAPPAPHAPPRHRPRGAATPTARARPCSSTALSAGHRDVRQPLS